MLGFGYGYRCGFENKMKNKLIWKVDVERLCVKKTTTRCGCGCGCEKKKNLDWDLNTDVKNQKIELRCGCGCQNVKIRNWMIKHNL